MLPKDFQNIWRDLKAKKFDPIYCLDGEEPFYIDLISDYMEKHIIPTENKDFDETIIYGKETTLSQIIQEAKQYPLGKKRLVLVKEAQELTQLGSSEHKKLFSHYLKEPAKTTILVFCHKYNSFPKSWEIHWRSKHIRHLRTQRIRDYKLPEWIINYVQSHKKKITQDAAQLLAQHVGTDLNRLSQEIKKIYLNLKENDRIESNHIHKFVGISKNYNGFELQRAVGKKKIGLAHTILEHMMEDLKTISPLQIIIGLSSYLIKLLLSQKLIRTGLSKQERAQKMRVHPYFLKEYEDISRNCNPHALAESLSLLREAEMLLKGIAGYSPNPTHILKNLLHQIMIKLQKKS
ncbi:MAG: DNA polymerase III subunit delta [Cytophagales bacterium]|nr:DNA polymerase III subunit delta [Cytophagales bacterium]